MNRFLVGFFGLVVVEAGFASRLTALALLATVFTFCNWWTNTRQLDLHLILNDELVLAEKRPYLLYPGLISL